MPLGEELENVWNYPLTIMEKKSTLGETLTPGPNTYTVNYFTT